MQSGPCQAQASLPAAERISVDYAARAGCAELASAALSARPARGPADRWTGVFPDRRQQARVRSRNPAPARRSAHGGGPGATARVPVLIGNTADEFTLFVALTYLRDKGLAPYRTLLTDTFGSQAPAVAAWYPLSRYDGSGAGLAAAVTDGVFACRSTPWPPNWPCRVPVYAYEFNDRHARRPIRCAGRPSPRGRACPGVALPVRHGRRPPLNAAQRALSEEMIAYWSRFVATPPTFRANSNGRGSIRNAPGCPCRRAARSSRRTSPTGTSAGSGIRWADRAADQRIVSRTRVQSSVNSPGFRTACVVC